MNKEDIKELLMKERGVSVEVLDDETPFDFKCDQCGKCCTNSTIESILYKPYDLYKIAKGLKVNILEVIKNNAEIYIGDSSGFPIARMVGKLNFEQGGLTMVCPFRKTVGDKHLCGIHEFKPGACKLFPLGRLSAFNKEKGGDPDIIYFMQEVTCGTKGELHTIKDWVGDTEYESKTLNLESEAVRTINDIVDLRKLKELATSYEECRGVVEAYYNAIFSTYYTNFDTKEGSRDFLVQFKENIESMTRMTKVLAYTLITHYQDEGATDFIKREVVSKTFKHSEMDFIEKMNMATEIFNQ